MLVLSLVVPCRLEGPLRGARRLGLEAASPMASKMDARDKAMHAHKYDSRLFKIGFFCWWCSFPPLLSPDALWSIERVVVTRRSAAQNLTQ